MGKRKTRPGLPRLLFGYWRPQSSHRVDPYETSRNDDHDDDYYDHNNYGNDHDYDKDKQYRNMELNDSQAAANQMRKDKWR